MNKIRNHTKELVVLTILLAVAVSVVNAAVFVYQPLSITAKWNGPLVRFDGGTNAGNDDLGGETIEVTISSDGTEASITVHPCRRGRTYYKDILRVVNDRDEAVYVGFSVDTPFDDSAIIVAQLIVKNATTGVTIDTIDLKAGGTTWVPWTLGSGNELRIDLRFEINSDEIGSDDASLSLIYSTVNELLP